MNVININKCIKSERSPIDEGIGPFNLLLWRNLSIKLNYDNSNESYW